MSPAAVKTPFSEDCIASDCPSYCGMKHNKSSWNRRYLQFFSVDARDIKEVTATGFLCKGSYAQFILAWLENAQWDCFSDMVNHFCIHYDLWVPHLNWEICHSLNITWSGLIYSASHLLGILLCCDTFIWWQYTVPTAFESSQQITWWVLGDKDYLIKTQL